MKQKKGWMILCLLWLAVMTAGCRAKDDSNGEQEAQKAVCYGRSANMRNGGLTEGDGEGIYYVWEGQLYYRREGSEARCIDSRGGRFLCLAGDTLYYVSEDADGRTGIYSRPNNGEDERKLICETAARYLYAYDGYLYYVNYPDGADICRVKTDGTEPETLSEGCFDSLLVTDRALFYRDYRTGQYFQRSFGENEELLEPEEWVVLTEDRMPMEDDGWIYYDMGDFLYHYKVSTDDRKQMGRIARSSDNVLFYHGKKYEGNTVLDLESGEQQNWNSEADIKLLGFAGERILYRSDAYGEEAILTPCPQPDSSVLWVYDLKSGENTELAKAAAGKLSEEEMLQAYDLLAAGNLNLLAEGAEGFARLYPLNGEWQKEDADFDGDGLPERFLKSGNNSILLHAASQGIWLYLFDEMEDGEVYEPLSDGTVLCHYPYVTEGYGNDCYTVYQYAEGGNRTQLSSMQHLTFKLDHIDPQTDTLVKADTYYLDEEFVGESEWQAALDAVLPKRVLQ